MEYFLPSVHLFTLREKKVGKRWGKYTAWRLWELWQEVLPLPILWWGGLSLSVFLFFSSLSLLRVPIFLALWIPRRGYPHFKFLPLLTFLLFLGGIFFLLLGGDKTLEKISNRKRWWGEEVLSSKNSIYGNVTVLKRKEQLTFYYDGLPLLTLPHPNISFLEDLVHFPLLFHPHPQKVLLISGGMGGTIGEILKHPGIGIDYKVFSDYHRRS